MLDSFKEVLEKEREAEAILDAARKNAKKIEADAQEKADLVYKQTFQETINQAKDEAIEIKQRAKKEAEEEAKVFLKRAESLKNKIEASSKQNFDEAINEVVNEFLS